MTGNRKGKKIPTTLKMSLRNSVILFDSGGPKPSVSFTLYRQPLRGWDKAKKKRGKKKMANTVTTELTDLLLGLIGANRLQVLR